MKKVVILLLTMLFGQNIVAKTFDQKIANMFILGFYGTTASPNSKIINDICIRGLGGVILFDRHPSQRKKAKNISSRTQLLSLNSSLINSCKHNPLISIDQEGGKVQRLKRKNGFYGKYPRANNVAKQGTAKAALIYANMAKELHSVGINYNLAPIADVAVNSNNTVIHKMGRSYSSDAQTTASFDKVFINQMRKRRVLTSLKHFPGHGSSLGDTHDGFVDITNTWQKNVELEPYRQLIATKTVDSIMVAHVFNRHLDKKYPSSLSFKTVTGLRRRELGYTGVVISDDLQMGAISKHFSLKQVIALSINAGIDILLFGNQLDPKNEVKLSQLVAITKQLIIENKINKAMIINANRRIDAMRSTIGLGK